MKVSLTKIEMYDLEINGTVYKDMRVTGSLEGVLELSNGTDRVTIASTLGTINYRLLKIFDEKITDDWVLLRATPDVIANAGEAEFRAKQDDRFVTGTGSAQPQQAAWPQPPRRDDPLVWPDLICEHDWIATIESTHRTCVYCKKSEEVTA